MQTDESLFTDCEYVLCECLTDSRGWGTQQLDCGFTQANFLEKVMFELGLIYGKEVVGAQEGDRERMEGYFQ